MTTKDFYLAAFLFCKHSLVGTTKQGNQTVFEFPDDPQVMDDMKQYYSGKSTVNPMDYANKIRNLKTIIHS